VDRGMEDVDRLPRARPVCEAQLGALLGARPRPVGGGVTRPLRENLLVLRHPRPVVVLGLELGATHAVSPFKPRTLRDRARGGKRTPRSPNGGCAKPPTPVWRSRDEAVE